MQDGTSRTSARHRCRIVGVGLFSSLGLLSATAACRTVPTTSVLKTRSTPVGDPQPHRTGIILDIDHTISDTSQSDLFFDIGAESRPYANARNVVDKLSDHYEIAYVTARPQWLTKKTRRWLTEHGFPPGRVLTTARLIDFFWPGSFKQRSVSLLRRSSPSLLIGIGNRHTDAEAYVANGMLALVINPDRAFLYPDESLFMKDWTQLEAFFETHADVLKDPAALRKKYGVGGPPLDPRGVATRPDIDLSLLAETPFLIPGLLVEGIAKIPLAHEQGEAREALQQVEAPFARTLQTIVDRFEDENLLKVRLATEDGLPAYVVTFLRQGRAFETVLDKSLATLEAPDEAEDRGTAAARRARSLAVLTFEEALTRSLDVVDGQAYEIELEIEEDRPQYEIALTTLGRFMEIEIDGVNGAVIEVEDETAVH